MFTIYNIPIACLLIIDRHFQPWFPKRNKSGLWRHIIETCHRLKWLYRENSNNVSRHDETPVKSTFSHSMSFLQLVFSVQKTCEASQLSKSDGIKVSNLETSAWQQRSISRSNLGFDSESCRSNAIWLVTVERSKSCDTISFVKLQRIGWKELIHFYSLCQIG